LIWKPEGKRPVGRSRHRCYDNIKMYVKEIILESVEWIQVAQDRAKLWVIVNTVMNLWVP
jgi:hypothetical protein